MYVTADAVMKRYNSMRTEYKKLRDKIKTSKSGSEGQPPTEVMKWKVKRWAFLEPFIKGKKAPFSQELGKVSIAFG